MNIAVFYYDGFSEFEIVLACLFFKEHNVISVALENREYRSEGRQRFCVDQIVHEVDLESLDLLIIPGGAPAPLVDNLELKNFVENLIARDKKVAGICGGASLLAGLGVLKGKKCTGMSSGMDPDAPSSRYFSESTFLDEHVVVDGNIITAQGQAYVEFAIELARQVDLCANEGDYEEALRWFKNIR
ncbi:MAG: DJ-1/PfpI family protein [Anaerolineales bacterium]|nr:DJ-1/PfpI family protein [Anaerolineales bacterium]